VNGLLKVTDRGLALQEGVTFSAHLLIGRSATNPTGGWLGTDCFTRIVLTSSSYTAFQSGREDNTVRRGAWRGSRHERMLYFCSVAKAFGLNNMMPW